MYLGADSAQAINRMFLNTQNRNTCIAKNMKAFSIGDTLIIVHLRKSYNRLKISTFSLNPNKKPLYTSFFTLDLTAMGTTRRVENSRKHCS